MRPTFEMKRTSYFIQQADAQIPQDYVDLLTTYRATDSERWMALVCLMRHEGAWTLQKLGDVCGVTRERIRQVESRCHETQHAAHLALDSRVLHGIPKPPLVERVRERAVPRRLNEEQVAELVALQAQATKVRGHTKPDDPLRAAAAELVRLLDQYQREGYSMYGMAQQLGLTPGALQFRMVRYGYRDTTGNSASYRRLMHVAERLDAAGVSAHDGGEQG